MATGVRISTLSLGLLIGQTLPLSAQANDQREDGNTARYDAMFGTPNRYTPVPPDQRLRDHARPGAAGPPFAVHVNGLAPIFFNSNAELRQSGRRHEFGRVQPDRRRLVVDAGLRPSVQVHGATRAPSSIASRRRQLSTSTSCASRPRLQYVDADNDQAFSPYVSYSPRWDFAPFYASWFETRQDLTFGINKTFNYDANFRRVPFSGNTFAETIWSFGMTVCVPAAVQRRRHPDRGPPSSSRRRRYVISPQWNVSLGAYMERRGFDFYQGFADEDWFIEPIATLEFVLPSRWFGSDANAALIGRPALDFQVAYERNWSTLAAFNYDAMDTSAPP